MRLLKHNTRRLERRRGAIAVLVALAIPMLLILTAFAVNVAYMQMVREQLRVTCDAAAKAALVSYGSTQSQSSAISFAQSVANLNLVGGQPVTISASNVVFGNATQGSGGVYAFIAGGSPTNSVQLTGTMSPSLFITTFMPVSKFTTSQVSVATRVAHDICLVLDRSASMAFDLSANTFEYPANVVTQCNGNAIEEYFTTPSTNTSTPSRWYELTLAVNSFVSTLQAQNIDVHVALVTFAETYSFGSYTATEANLDVALPSAAGAQASNFTAVETAMNNYTLNPLLGNTNLSAGLALAQTELTTTPPARTTADRTIIMFTDGMPTSGNTDISAITLSYCQTSQIVTHVITFGAEAGSGAAQTMMQQAAANGNGMYFCCNDGTTQTASPASQLQSAFQTIAESLPAVLIK